MEFWNRKMRSSFFVKTVSIILIQTFLLSTIAFAAPASPANTQDPSKVKEVITDPEKIVVPKEAGMVKSKFTGNSGKLIVHIQDAHCNFEAQSNIIKILEGLIKNDSLSLISVEGADGMIDTTWFKSFPDEEIRKEVATYFMKKGEITGPEFLSITSDYNIKLFGAETRSYYIENLAAFTSSYPMKADTEKYYNDIKSVLNKLKGYIYSDELKIMDEKSVDYESKKLQFNDYVRFLQKMAEKYKINLREYENFFKLVSVLIYESKIDFNVTDKERSALIDEMSKGMSKEELSDLVAQSLAFKVGKVSSAEYYIYLQKLALKKEIDVFKSYPNLYNYIIYNAVYSRIDNEKLFKDIKALEVAIKEKLFANDDQRTLEKLSRHIEILLGLVNIKLLNDDFDYYKAHKDEFTHEAFTSFTSKKGTQYGLAYDIEPPSDAVSKAIPKLEEFYVVAVKRDKALVDNTIKAMKDQKQDIAVLVTGGFHSEGIAKLLEKQGISYVVVCPNITKDVETPYLKILTNQRTPLEDILVDNTTPQTKQSMLAPISVTQYAGFTPEVIRDRLGRGLDKEIVDGIIERTQNVITGWETELIAGWFNEIGPDAKSGIYAKNPAVMQAAYKFAMVRAITTDLAREAGRIEPTSQDSEKAHRLADAILTTAGFQGAFNMAFDKFIAARSIAATVLGANLSTAPTGGNEDAVAIRMGNGGIVSAKEHGVRRYGNKSYDPEGVGPNTLNGVIWDNICKDESRGNHVYAISNNDIIAKFEDDVLIKSYKAMHDNLRDMPIFDFLIKAIADRKLDLVVIKDLKHYLGPDLSDIIFHVGVSRKTVYMDEKDFLFLLSLDNPLRLFEEALDHELEHIKDPNAPESVIRRRAPAYNLRAALETKGRIEETIAMLDKVSIDNDIIRGLAVNIGRGLEINVATMGDIVRLMIYKSEIINHYFPNRGTNNFNSREYLFNALHMAIGRSIEAKTADIRVAAIFRDLLKVRGFRSLMPTKSLQYFLNRDGALIFSHAGPLFIQFPTVGSLLDQIRLHGFPEHLQHMSTLLRALLYVAPDYAPTYLLSDNDIINKTRTIEDVLGLFGIKYSSIEKSIRRNPLKPNGTLGITVGDYIDRAFMIKTAQADRDATAKGDGQIRKIVTLKNNNGELMPWEHGTRTARDLDDLSPVVIAENIRNEKSVSGAITDLILNGHAEAVYIDNNLARDGDRNISLMNLTGNDSVKLENIRVMMRSEMLPVRFVVIEGLKDELRNRSIAPDLIAHPGFTRKAIYMDKKDFMRLLSQENYIELIKEALLHENKHLFMPETSEITIEGQFTTANVRKILEEFKVGQNSYEYVDWSAWEYSKDDRNVLVKKDDKSVLAKRLLDGSFAVYSGGTAPVAANIMASVDRTIETLGIRRDIDNGLQELRGVGLDIFFKEEMFNLLRRDDLNKLSTQSDMKLETMADLVRLLIYRPDVISEQMPLRETYDPRSLQKLWTKREQLLSLITYYESSYRGYNTPTRTMFRAIFKIEKVAEIIPVRSLANFGELDNYDRELFNPNLNNFGGFRTLGEILGYIKKTGVSAFNDRSLPEIDKIKEGSMKVLLTVLMYIAPDYVPIEVCRQVAKSNWKFGKRVVSIFKQCDIVHGDDERESSVIVEEVLNQYGNAPLKHGNLGLTLGDVLRAAAAKQAAATVGGTTSATTQPAAITTPAGSRPPSAYTDDTPSNVGPSMGDTVTSGLAGHGNGGLHTMGEIKAADEISADELRKTRDTLGINTNILGKKLILAYDMELDPDSRGAVQAGERAINKYLNGNLIEVRGTGNGLRELIRQAVSDLGGQEYVVVTIAGEKTVNEVGQARRGELGKLIQVANVDGNGNKLYVPVIGLYDLALRIAYGNEDSIRDCLSRIAEFGPKELEDFLKDGRTGFMRILPKIAPANINDMREAYKAAEAALKSL